MAARTDGTDPMREAPYWLESARGSKEYSLKAEENDFLLTTREMELRFGMTADGLLQFASGRHGDASHGTARMNPFPESAKSFPDSVKGKRLYVRLDMERLLSRSALADGEAGKWLSLLFGRYRTLTYVLSDGGKATLTLQR